MTLRGVVIAVTGLVVVATQAPEPASGPGTVHA